MFEPDTKVPTPSEIDKLVRRFGDPHESGHSMAERFAVADALKAASAEVSRLQLAVDHHKSVALDYCTDADAALRVEIGQLQGLVQRMMARLADLLDADQFNNIEAMALAADVPYPEQLRTIERCAKKLVDNLYEFDFDCQYGAVEYADHLLQALQTKDK